MLLSLMWVAIGLYAQTTMELRGTVVDTSNDPIPGATVQVLGQQSMGTLTDMDGHFTLKAVPKDATIRVSYIGMKSEEIKLDGKSSIRVVLHEDAEILDELVVTALGIKRSEKALSYNVQEIKSDELTTVKDANFINALSGKVAGVNINASSAGLGGATRVVMRGPKSINSSNQALYVIDGIPMFNTSKGSIGGGAFSEQPGGEGISDINPDDIETLTVLSGPAAAALYGSAAAQGVIMITTKSGKAGRVSVTISNSSQFLRPFVLPEFQDSYINRPGEIGSWGEKANSPYGKYDPAGFFKTGMNIQNTVALNVGNEKSRTYLSLGSTNARGILPNSGYDRYNVTARNTTTFLDDIFTLDLSLNYIRAQDKNLMAQGAYFNPLPMLYLFPRGDNFDSVRVFETYNPVRKIYEQNWRYGELLNSQNPYWTMHRMIRTNSRERYMAAASLKAQVTDWLDISTRFRYDNTKIKNEDKRYASTATIFAHSPYGFYSYENGSEQAVYGDLIANLNLNVGDDFSIAGNIGGSANYSSTRSEGFRGGLRAPSNIFTPNAIDYAAGKKENAPIFGGVRHLIYSAFGSAELGYKSTYFLTVTGRNDWDSALAGTSHESFFYPSVGVSALLSEYIPTEYKRYVGYLKVRGSWASVGSAISPNIASPYRYSFDPATGGYKGSTIKFPETFFPERTNSWEVGLTGKFFSIWDVDLTLYRSNTTNQTFLRPASAATGYDLEYVQTGDVQNQGIELSTGLQLMWGDFAWSPRYTFSANQNKIVKLLSDDSESIKMGGLNGIEVVLSKGGTMGDVYDYTSIKRDQEGYPLVENNTIVPENLTNPVYRGTTLPSANMGLLNDFEWKDLSFGFLISARIGGIVMSQTQAYLDQYGVSKASADLREKGGVKVNLGQLSAEEYYKRTAGEKPLWRNYIYSATNVRLQQMHLNYTLPEGWFANKARITLGVNANNILMIYKKAPFDPELSASTGTYYQGFDYFMQPSMQSFGFTAKVQF